MNAPKPWLDLDQLEQRLCVITAEQLGLPLVKVKPESRLIEDLNCDSLDLVELIMETEDEFGLTIPSKPETPVGKLIFTRKPFRLRDLAEFAFLNQGTVSPVRRTWRNRNDHVAPAIERDFTQLGGRLDERLSSNSRLFEPLESSDKHPLFRRTTDGMVCVKIPESAFVMGCDESSAEPDEKPTHTVKLSTFLIDIEPVSVTAFCRFLNSIDGLNEEFKALIGLREDDDRIAHMQFAQNQDDWRPRSGTEMQPVVMVNWFAANAYSIWANGCDWRSYQSSDSFLPSEAQWEFAASGAFSDQEAILAGSHERGEAYDTGLLPIANVHQSLGVSRFGLRHMSGTVWHWCRDWYDPNFYATSQSLLQNPAANVETGIRSERGGSWVGPIGLCRTTYRRGRNPEARGRCLGFRCVSRSSGAAR